MIKKFTKLSPAKQFLVFLITFTVIGGGWLVYSSFAATENVKGLVTWQPDPKCESINETYTVNDKNYKVYQAAAHREDADENHVWTFNSLGGGSENCTGKGGAWILIENPDNSNKTLVHVTDWCDDDGDNKCKELDIDKDAWNILKGNKQSVGKVRFWCLGHDAKPEASYVNPKKCLVGDEN